MIFLVIGIKSKNPTKSVKKPGNINNIQLSPTVQATKSNYLRAHGGKKTKFIDYFIKKTKFFNCLQILE